MENGTRGPCRGPRGDNAEDGTSSNMAGRRSTSADASDSACDEKPTSTILDAATHSAALAAEAHELEPASHLLPRRGPSRQRAFHHGAGRPAHRLPQELA